MTPSHPCSFKTAGGQIHNIIYNILTGYIGSTHKSNVTVQHVVHVRTYTPL